MVGVFSLLWIPSTIASDSYMGNVSNMIRVSVNWTDDCHLYIEDDYIRYGYNCSGTFNPVYQQLEFAYNYSNMTQIIQYSSLAGMNDTEFGLLLSNALAEFNANEQAWFTNTLLPKQDELYALQEQVKVKDIEIYRLKASEQILNETVNVNDSRMNSLKSENILLQIMGAICGCFLLLIVAVQSGWIKGGRVIGRYRG